MRLLERHQEREIGVLLVAAIGMVATPARCGIALWRTSMR